MKKSIRILFLCLLTAGCVSAVYAGAETVSISEKDLFCQRLLKDAEDKDARKYFRELARDKSEPEKMKLLRVTELLAYIDFLKQRLVNLTGTEVKVKKFQKQSSNQNGSLDDLIQQLSMTKRELVEQIEQRQLESIQLKTKKDVPYSENSFANQVEDINTLKGDVDKFRKSFEEIQERMNLADGKIQALTDDLAAKTIEVFEKDEIIAQQKQEVTNLEKKVAEVQERLTLGQRLIQEKNNRIEELQVEEEVAQLRGQFEEMQKKFEEQTRDGKLRMTVLEKLLAEQEKRMADYALELQAKSEKMEQLASLALERSRQVSELNTILQSKDQKLLEMDGIIEIYKGKLTESNKILQEKIHHIKSLENQLVETQRRIYRSQIDLEQMDDQLILLNERILSLP